MSQFSYGLKVDGILIGAVAVDGGPGTVLANPGKVKEDTIQLNPKAITDTDFTGQGDSAPSISISKANPREGSFDLMTMDKEVIADLTGGTVTGTGENMIYNSPVGTPNIERTLKFVDVQQNDWLMARVKIKADLVGTFRNGELNVLRVDYKVLQPTKTGVSDLQYGKPASGG